MASNSGFGRVPEGDLQAFVQELTNFTPGELLRLSQHFRQDVIYVLENEFVAVISDLVCEDIITHVKAEEYIDLEKRQGANKAATTLVENILKESKEVGIGLWLSLFELRNRSSHPNLHGMIEEIIHNGKALLDEMILNDAGPPLDPVLKAYQEEHRSLLCEQTQWMKESNSGSKPGQNFSLLNRYVELKVVSDAHFRGQNQGEHEALAAAGELYEYRLHRKIQTELERITQDRLFRWCFRSKRKPLSVMVSGVAGVGKTTLVQKFVFDWARGRHYQKFTFLFYFKFRDLNTVGPKTSLESLILREYPSLQDKLETVLEKPENLLFIFDGLDESNRNLDLSKNRTPEFCTEPGDVKPVNVIVSSLLTQTLLKGCSVLLTSRPSKLAQLETGVLHRVTSIVGFLSKEREQYFQNFFGDPEVAQKALAHVRDGQVLYTLCYNPSYCWITCTALQPCFSGKRGQPPPLPKTVTQLFVRYVKHMLDNHTVELPENNVVREMLRGLGWLADYGLNNHVLVFDQNHLECFDVKRSPLLTAFLVENIHGDTSSSEVTYSFVHLTVQEFFAALVHYLDFKEIEFEDTMARAHGCRSGEYEIFLRFLSGLSHPATRAPLETVLGRFSPDATRKAIDLLTQVDSSLVLSLEKVEDKKRALNFFNLFFEAHNSQLVRRVMGDDARLDFSDLYLMPVDCTIISYILSCYKMMELLNLDCCLIQNEGLQKLSSELHKIRELSLRNNDLRDSAVKDVVRVLTHRDCQLETLRLSKNGLTEECCEELSSALRRNQSLLWLDLKTNKLRDKGLNHLLGALSSPHCRIQTLIVQENALTDACCGTLSAALATNTSLKTLNLSGNAFTDRCAQEMVHFIQTCPALTEIRLSLTDMTPRVEERLKELASRRRGLRIVI